MTSFFHGQSRLNRRKLSMYVRSETRVHPTTRIPGNGVPTITLMWEKRQANAGKIPRAKECWVYPIKARLRTLKDLDAAAVQAGNVSKVVLDPNVADIEIRQTVFKLMSRLDLETSVQQIHALVRPPEDVYYKELRTSYRRVCRFLPTLLKTVVFRASPAGWHRAAGAQ